MTADGNVFSESVIIRTRQDRIRSYVPRKGIDIIFEQVDEIEDPQGIKPHEYRATLTGSDIIPEESITPQDLTKVLSDWRSIVSDRARVQRKQPLKHTIDTFVDRPKQQMNDQLKSRIDALLPEDIVTRDGKKWARVFSGEVK